jgi:PAS domain S-box-containing protein
VAERFWESDFDDTRRSYSRYITIGAILGLLAVVLGALTLGTTFKSIRAEETRQSQILTPADAALNDTYRYFIDQETAVRGYIISQDRRFLQPYIEASRELPALFAQLDYLAVRMIPSGESKVNRIIREHRDWVDKVAEPEISFVVNGQQDRAFEIVASGLGRENFDEIRAAVSNLEDALAAERARSDETLVGLEERLATLLVVTLLSLAGLILLAVWLLRRRVVGPLTRELREQAGLIDLAQDAIITRMVAGPITFWSRGAEILYGFTKDEAMGKRSKVLLQTKLPEPKEVLEAKFFEDGHWTGLLTHTTKSGEEVMVASRWLLRRDSAGQPSSIFEVNTNVSDRALTALRSATEQQFRKSRPTRLVSNRPAADELREAVEKNDITVHYQPLVRLGDHKIVGAEALMRWNHPSRGLVAPDGFLDEAIEHDMMDEMSQLVLARSVSDLGKWEDHELFVSINLDTKQLLSSGLPLRLEAMLNSANIAPDRVWLEIPESLYAEHFSGAVQVVGELRDLGCRIALDDFGTGTSSLDWLARVPVDALKVDQRFIRGIGHSASDQAVLRAVAGLGQELGMILVAEGIETIEHRDALVDLGYDYGQGYLFSRAVDQEALQQAVLPTAVLRPDLFVRR